MQKKIHFDPVFGIREISNSFYLHFKPVAYNKIKIIGQCIWYQAETLRNKIKLSLCSIPAGWTEQQTQNDLLLFLGHQQQSTIERGSHGPK